MTKLPPPLQWSRRMRHHRMRIAGAEDVSARTPLVAEISKICIANLARERNKTGKRRHRSCFIFVHYQRSNLRLLSCLDDSSNEHARTYARTHALAPKRTPLNRKNRRTHIVVAASLKKFPWLTSQLSTMPSSSTDLESKSVSFSDSRSQRLPIPQGTSTFFYGTSTSFLSC